MARSSASLAGARREVRSAVDWVTPALVAVFVLSGASGLIYQIAWVRLLSLTFGVTIYAVSTVVAAFMGGLALGSYLGGRWADRVRRPTLWYALAELLIGAIGLLSPTALSWVQSIYVALYPPDASEAVLGIVALRFALAGLVLLVPTALMGATLPLMVKGSLATGREIAVRVSWLYASNTAGAILGTLAAGFVLIGMLGITGTIRGAATLNLAAAATAALVGALSSTERKAPTPEGRNEGSVRTTFRHPHSAIRIVVIITFAVQGFASLAYEVIWFRVLAVLLDGSTYAFSIVLATVLLGIALGSAVIGPLIARQLAWVRIYALLQAGVSSFALLGLVAFAHIYGITGRLGELGPLRAAVESHFGWMVVAAVVAILPPTLLLGASLPIAARIVVPEASHAGRGVGVLYAGNAAAAILGAWAAGFVLIPHLGTQRSIEALAIVNAALAIALALVGEGRRAITASAAMTLVLGSFLAAQALAPQMFGRMAEGRFPDADLVWFAEGQETSVIVARDRSSGSLDMYLNAQGQASDDPAVVRFHRLLGHLPMALHPDPQDVLIVGLGGGATAGALAQHAPRRIDIVELAEAVPKGATYFAHINGGVLGYPNLNLKIDDGRNHLLLTRQKYDVITADAINPRGAGAAMLYSSEYYALARNALKPGGIVAQWLEVNPQNPDNEAQRKLMARTFQAVFPYVSLWGYGALMIGAGAPLDATAASIAARWAASSGRDLGRILADMEFATPESFADSFVFGDADFRAWVGEGPIMTDDRPYVEYFLSLPGGSALNRWQGRLSGVLSGR